MSVYRRTQKAKRYGLAAVELTEIAGIELDQWQIDAVVESMLVDPDDKWWYPLVCVGVSRQNGKGEILQARELFGVIKLQETILHTAQVLATSKDGFKRAYRTVTTSELDAYLTNDRWANGEEALEFGSDVQAINYRARSGKAGRGLTQVDFIAYDEAQHLNEDQIAASSPTQLVAEFPQTYALGSGGLATSDKWWEWRLQGLVAADDGKGKPMAGLIIGKIPGELLWIEYTAETITIKDGRIVETERPDIDNAEAHARANPAYPHRVTPEGLRKMRRELGDAAFLRECMGCWDPLPTSKGSSQTKLTMDSWAQGVDQSSSTEYNDVLAVSCMADLERTTVAVGGYRSDGARHIEVIRNDDGTDWVFAKDSQGQRWLSKRVTDNGIRSIVYDSSGPTRALKSDLEAVAEECSVDLVALSNPDFAAASASLCEVFPKDLGDGERQAWHLGNAVTRNAIKVATLRSVGSLGAWCWESDGEHDITPLRAVTMADWVTKSMPPPVSRYEDDGLMVV